VIIGERYTRGAPDASGAETAVALPTQFLANLFVFKDNVGVRGLTVGLGIYNIFGVDYRFVHASASTPEDMTAAAALAAYRGDHAPLPGLDREIMLRVSYLVEPNLGGGP